MWPFKWMDKSKSRDKRSKVRNKLSRMPNRIKKVKKY